MQWSPRPAEAVALLAIGTGLGMAALLLDAPGLVLVGGGALLLLLVGTRDLLARPRLSAGPDGLYVRGWSRARHLPWAGLQVRVRETRRLGMRGKTLELDTAAGPDDEGVLVVLGRRDLGADPERVAQQLRTLDPTA